MDKVKILWKKSQNHEIKTQYFEIKSQNVEMINQNHKKDQYVEMKVKIWDELSR